MSATGGTWSRSYSGDKPETPKFFDGIEELTVHAITVYMSATIAGRADSIRGLMDEAEERRAADTEAVPWRYLNGLMGCCQLMEELAAVFAASACLGTFGRVWLGANTTEVRAQLGRWADGNDLTELDVARLLGIPNPDDWRGGLREPTESDRQLLNAVRSMTAGAAASVLRGVGRAHRRLEILYDKWRHCPAAVAPIRLDQLQGRPWALVAVDHGRKRPRDSRIIPLTPSVAAGVGGIAEDAFALTQMAVKARHLKLTLRDDHALPWAVPGLDESLLEQYGELLRWHYEGATSTEINVTHIAEGIWLGDPWLTGEDLAAALRAPEWPQRPG